MRHLQKSIIFLTSFLEGVTVLVIEIAGARALAPFYGSSLQVWTAQITATLLFLALGYGFGGWLCKRLGNWKLGAMFSLGGAWLILYPYWRNDILAAFASIDAVAVGSFLASSVMLGLPLFCMGAITPLLVERLNNIEEGAGFAAGRLFFINTIGGLAGGWLTALVLIPSYSLRVSLTATAVCMVSLGVFWFFFLKSSRVIALALFALSLWIGFQIPKPSDEFDHKGNSARVLERQQSGNGLVEVIDLGPYGLYLTINGAVQGGFFDLNDTSAVAFSEYLNCGSHQYHPKATSALVLGMGAGVLAKQLNKREVDTTVVEIEPVVTRFVREYFGLAPEIKVVDADARVFINRSENKYDLIFLDVFSGESVPWYLVTTEAFERIKGMLNPGGRLLINTIALAGGNLGLEKLESVLVSAFGEARVYEEKANNDDLINVLLVAGRKLEANKAECPSELHPGIRAQVAAMLAEHRPARAGFYAMTDDFSDLDHIESKVRLGMRKGAQNTWGADILSD